MLHFYNSLTNKVEEFKPKEDKKVNIYVCGPTVYNYIHIGNARPVVFFDLVKRYLEFCGYNVKYSSNITDIDDKIINKAKEMSKTEKEIAEYYEKAYFEDCARLNALRPDYTPHATSYIKEMIDFISSLIKEGYAYEKEGNVYFRVNKVENYGILSKQTRENLAEGARVEVNPDKEDPQDFTLWKKTEEGIKWDSPFGKGRPGWHTECVCMIHNLFGDTIDIHGGGMDLKFPHHENEICQCEARYHKDLAKYFLHVGRVDLKGTKMSKSLGNYIFVRDFDTLDKANVLRMLLLFSPYRANINYTEELFNQYVALYNKWQRALKQTYYFLEANDISSLEQDEIFINKFKEFMDDDFNVQNVLTLIEELVKEINQLFRSKDYQSLAIKINTFNTILDIFGIKFDLPNLTEELKETYLNWQEARKNADYNSADIYRNILVDKGIL